MSLSIKDLLEKKKESQSVGKGKKKLNKESHQSKVKARNLGGSKRIDRGAARGG